MTKVRVKLNKKTVAWYLKGGGGVAADIERRANAIAASAGQGFEVDTRVGRRRARASVITGTHDAQRAEATDRSLSRALGAGR